MYIVDDNTNTTQSILTSHRLANILLKSIVLLVFVFFFVLFVCLFGGFFLVALLPFLKNVKYRIFYLSLPYGHTY